MVKRFAVVGMKKIWDLILKFSRLIAAGKAISFQRKRNKTLFLSHRCFGRKASAHQKIEIADFYSVIGEGGFYEPERKTAFAIGLVVLLQCLRY